MEIIGWIGSILFAACGLPQMIQSVREKHSHGLNWAFLGMWATGEILTLIYIIPKLDWPLLFNYCFNLVCLIPIMYYKAFPKR